MPYEEGNPLMLMSIWTRCRLALTVVVVAFLAAACASVDLGPRYDPPPVRAPQPLPPAQTPSATPQPVPPAVSSPQPLPPIGQTASSTRDPREAIVTLTTRMDGSSAVPPTRSAGVGQLDAIYDTNTRLLRWKTSWSGLGGPITAAQFHGPGDDGQVAPPTLVWPGPFGATYEGRATLTPQQATDLLDGRWYINVQTATHPAGEIRGQLRVVH